MNFLRSTGLLERIGAGFFLLLVLSQAGTSEIPSQTRVLRGVSGQFVVTGPPRRSPLPPVAHEGESTPPWVEVEPATLLLTCERVRSALRWELDIPNPWTGRVYVVVNPALPNNQAPLIGARYFLDGWQYRLEIPGWIDTPKLVRGLVQVLLLEFANRSMSTNSAEIPLWLLEGVTQYLLHASLADLVIQPPARGASKSPPFRNLVRNEYRPDPMAQARDRLQSHAALSFTRMAEVSADDLAEETWKTFQACSQLFVFHLLQEPGARPALLNMLLQLARHRNWQTAFLNAFGYDFPRMIDVEKWWSLVLVHFTGLDPLNAWSQEVALDKLDELLHPPVLVPRTRDALPQRQKITLQEIIQSWDYVRQRIVLQGVLNQLQLVRPKFPPETISLLDEYRETLADYMARRNRTRSARAPLGAPPMSADRLVNEIKTRLDQLDQRRADALPKAPKPQAPSKPEAPASSS